MYIPTTYIQTLHPSIRMNQNGTDTDIVLPDVVDGCSMQDISSLITAERNWNGTNVDFWLPTVVDYSSIHEMIRVLPVVCKDWNRIIINDPELWKTRILEVAPVAGELQRLYRLYPCMQGIHIFGPTKQLPCPANIELFKQLRVLYITIDHKSECPTSFMSRLVHMPALVELDICFKIHNSPMYNHAYFDVPSYSEMKQSIQRIQLKDLRTLRVEGLSTQRLCSWINAPNLHILDLRGPMHEQAYEEQINMSKIAWLFPSIKHLSITNLVLQLPSSICALLYVNDENPEMNDRDTSELNNAALLLRLDTLLVQHCALTAWMPGQSDERTLDQLDAFHLDKPKIRHVTMHNITYTHRSSPLVLDKIQKEYKLAEQKGLDAHFRQTNLRCTLPAVSPNHSFVGTALNNARPGESMDVLMGSRLL